MTMTQSTLEEAVAQVTAIAAAHAEQVDIDGAYPVDSVAALRSSGLLGLVISEDVGGMGAGPVEFTEVLGAIAAACGSTAMIYLMHPPRRPRCQTSFREWHRARSSAPWRSARKGRAHTSGLPCLNLSPTGTISASPPTKAG